VERILEIWGNARRKTIERASEEGSKVKDEGFLCGEFGVVDAFFWPVLWVCMVMSTSSPAKAMPPWFGCY